MMASATLASGARMTPTPCVPSSSLMMTGAPPTRSMAADASWRSRTKVDDGMRTLWRESSCSDRSLSRELAMPCEVLGV